MRKIRALVLFSGGLDSMLTVKVLQSQGIEVEAVSFESIFFSADKARESAKELGVKLIIINKDEDILGLVKNPVYGHGKHLNPCLDCRAMMIRSAAETLSTGMIFPETGGGRRQEDPSPTLPETGGGRNNEVFDFIASGEVLGQRPFSQNKMALSRMAKLAGLEIVRPLSAKLLRETEAEKKGLVKRELLLGLNGRGRDRQIALAHEYGIRKYPSPDGGCILTQVDFSQRLGEMLKEWPNCVPEDARLLKYGRPYWLALRNDGGKARKVLAMVGRVKADNDMLLESARSDDVLIELEDFLGPVCLLRGLGKADLRPENNGILRISVDLSDENVLKERQNRKNAAEILETACWLTANHYPRARGKKISLKAKFIN